MHGDILIGDWILIARLQHASSVVFHEVSILNAEVLENFIGDPATNEGDELRVNAWTNQGIGSGGTKTE